jgi:hypothetical protein
MTFAEGVTLGIVGTTLTIVSLAIAYHIGSDNKKKDEETKEKKRFRKIFPG